MQETEVIEGSISGDDLLVTDALGATDILDRESIGGNDEPDEEDAVGAEDSDDEEDTVGGEDE